jgi:hypothetical protein
MKISRQGCIFFHRHTGLLERGFALVVSISLMILLTVVAVGLLGLAAVELRRSSSSDARVTAMANARLGMMLAIGQLQSELGDDRRITADASMFNGTVNPHAVGVWNGWSPNLATQAPTPGSAGTSYAAPKSQSGFRSWLVSATDPQSVRQLDWHKNSKPTSTGFEMLFNAKTSGFDLGAAKIPLSSPTRPGSVAWAVTQENTKARINIGVEDSKRLSLEDRLQTPSRPDLSNSASLRQPASEWTRRASAVCRLPQASLDGAFGASRDVVAKAARDFTTEALSLLTNPVKGGVKTDLTTGFDMTDADFRQDKWSDPSGQVNNPFRSTAPAEYKGQRPLYQPFSGNTQASVTMNFPPASVDHKFNVNGAATFDMLRSYYRTYRHLYSSSSGTTAFERPYSHIGMPNKVTDRPYGEKSHPSLAPVLDRVNLVMSIYAKSDGTLCILLTPFVTVWNPHNVDVETEGLVVYPWIDFAVFWNWRVTARSGSVATWGSSLSRFVGEGYDGNGQSVRPYFYLHLTQTGGRSITPSIRLEPGEVRMFCLAESGRRDLEILGTPALRTWRMKAVGSASDISNSLKSGIALNMRKSFGGGSNFNYQLKSGDVVNSNIVEFDRNSYFYIVNMADSWQIKNPNVELMVNSRPAQGQLPALEPSPNLHFYGQIHSGQAFGKGRDSFTYPSYRFEEIKDFPQLVGSVLTYHRTALAGTLPQSDLMFTTNPRQPYVTPYLGAGGKFQTGPHYESLMQGGTSLSQLAMETTPDGRKAFYGPSHSSNTGRSNLAFFEIPRSPTLSLGSFQHCDLTATAFGCPSQIANSWASPYLEASSVAKRVTEFEDETGRKIPISPLLGVYDVSYLANEALFDEFYLSGAAPFFGSRKSNTGSTRIWDEDQITESLTTNQVLETFFKTPRSAPLRNPRMLPHTGGLPLPKIRERLNGPAKCVRLASHLMYEGGFNVNSTSEEAWIAVLSSLRGAKPASGNKTAQSRFRHILSSSPTNMAENDPWSGFRTLSDADVKTLARNLVEEIKLRGPFLSLGEFVNRRVSSESNMNLAGAIQSAIDKSKLNQAASYSSFNTDVYPHKENLTNKHTGVGPNTGTNTPGWLTQADVLHGLAPSMTVRSDTFIIRSLGEAKSPDGRVLATVRLEAVVQRVPDWVDSTDDASLPVAQLQSATNRTFGRRFSVVSLREITLNPDGDPI